MNKKQVVIIDYGAGNIRSLSYALERLGAMVHISSLAGDIESAEKVIFPGVGHAYQAMEQVREKNLQQLIPTLTQPFLGICLGMQMLFSKSEEGPADGIGILDGEVQKFRGSEKIPHMGWNTLAVEQDSPLLQNLPREPYAYFVHSYFAPKTENCLLSCHYSQDFAAAVQKENFYGCQFHPEKSGKTGDTILKNFLNL